MTCLLGICDAIIPHSYSASSHTNKIGGIPDWPDSVQVAVPCCQVCKMVQVLVVQLYCCLENSAYHRTLYVFACSNPSCRNNEQSWTVYRCQSVANGTFNSQAYSVSHNDSNTGAKDDCDDWGVDADDWGIDADDWGSGAEGLGTGADGADDWNDATDDWDDSIDKTDSQPNNTDLGATICAVSKEGPTHELLQDSDKGKQERSDDCLEGMNMNQLFIDDVTDDITDDVTDDDMVEGKPETGSHILAEDIPCLSEQEKLNILQSLNASCDSASSNSVTEKVLQSYFINVFEEPASHVEDDYHVAKLIKDYQKREGCSVKEMLKDSRCESGGKVEQYEKTSLLHRDLIFHKFMKRLSACPEQCIRYQWNGTPLFNKNPSSKLPSTCCHCGGEVVFELQLTPALINHLRFSDQKGSAVEFGTVLVYTCKQSCWDESASYRIEYAVLQTDPDQHLFK